MTSAVVTFKSPQPPKVDHGPTTAATSLEGGKADEMREKQKLGHRRIDRQGEVSYKRVPTNALMGAIQLGIANSIGSLASKPERQLLVQDFDYIENVAFPSEGSLTTPSHQYGDFRFKTYAPMAFRHFRDLFNIKPADFLRSICTEPLKELSNPGASGSIFYVSSDDQFIIKTVQKKEAEFFQRLLSGYYMNIHQNPKTLLPKFFGFFCYQSFGKNIRLLVMNNLFPQTIAIHEKYDLKGSTYKRMASKAEREKNAPTLKDLDFLKDHKDGIMLDPVAYDALVKVLGRDTLVLRCFRIMDYSMLVGVHNLDIANEAGTGNTTEEEGGEQPGTSRAVDVRHKRSQRLKSKFSMWGSLQGDDGFSNNPADGIPARNTRGENLLLFIGIIDILQSYRISKKIEHIWKSVLHDGDTVSVHHPDFYAERFQNFIQNQVFKKLPALKHSPSRKRTMTRRSVSDKDDEVDGQARASARRNYRLDLEKKSSQKPDKKESRRLFANVDPRGAGGETDTDMEVLANETTPLDLEASRLRYDSAGADTVLRMESVEISIEEPYEKRP
ncbi:hypothetical protein QR680_009196 [Steinernema hermaphroditum]|uniref:PIPK domain-containing protein n=1 Tax=Steinernema hermaphroditum TaxID=289476 RepID=A0AA39IL74_9BILA|nr:hypothetical protein QR680_009196 [Steinernema hermaphroditum]